MDDKFIKFWGELNMIYVGIGSLSFVLFLMFDYYNFSNSIFKKHISSLLGIVIISYSFYEIMFISKQVTFPKLVNYISVVLAAVSGFLLIYSLFLELPFKNTYTDNTYNAKLVDTGTYALTRHPGVLWFFLFFLFLFLTTGKGLLLIAGIVWSTFNSLYVYIQEKMFFVKIFPSYDQYQKTTPMLVPNKNSIKKCITTTFSGGRN